MAINVPGGTSEEARLLWKLAGLGFQFGTEIIAGVLLGWLVDRWFGTAPWGVVIGSLAGIAVALLHLFRKAVQLNREMDLSAPKPKPLRQPAAEEETEATHEHWKAQRDRELEPNEDRDDQGVADTPRRGDEAAGRRHEG